MGALAAMLPLALAAHLVSIDGSALREGCDPQDRAIAQLNPGDPIAIRFAVSGEAGPCYKVDVQSGGKTISGYLPASAISGVAEFERQRRNAPPATVPSASRFYPGRITGLGTAGAADIGSRAARLIEENRPAEALDLLAPAVSTKPADAGLLSLAGYAAYRADDIPRAIGFLTQSLDIQANPAVQRLLATAEREAREDKSGEKLVGMRFVLRYNRNEMDPATAGEVLAVLDQEFLRISAELGCPAEERIAAVVQSPDEYSKTTEAAAWSGGLYNGRIRVAAANQGQLTGSVRQALSHEIVHACLAGLGNQPRWLHEGLAQKLSGAVLPESQMVAVKKLARSGALPRLESLSQTWSRMSPAHATLAYGTALAAVELFYQQYGSAGVRNLLQNPDSLPRITEELDRRLRE